MLFDLSGDDHPANHKGRSFSYTYIVKILIILRPELSHNHLKIKINHSCYECRHFNCYYLLMRISIT